MDEKEPKHDNTTLSKKEEEAILECETICKEIMTCMMNRDEKQNVHHESEIKCSTEKREREILEGFMEYILLCNSN
jgi:hypothetical protein